MMTSITLFAIYYLRSGCFGLSKNQIQLFFHFLSSHTNKLKSMFLHYCIIGNYINCYKIPELVLYQISVRTEHIHLKKITLVPSNRRTIAEILFFVL